MLYYLGIEVLILSLFHRYKHNFQMFVINGTDITSEPKETFIDKPKEEFIVLSHCTISLIGIVTNFTVIAVFLNDRKLRKKIPNIFIIDQVSFMWNDFVFSVKIKFI